MRKHFLILMLLTLLPLAGFAADFNTEATVTVVDKYFGKAPTIANVTVVINSAKLSTAKYSIDETDGKVNYYTDATCTVKAALAAGKLTPNVGTYYLKIVPADTDNSGWAAGKIIVREMPLTLTVTNANKTYGQDDPASYTISALTDADATDVMAALASKVTVIRQPGENVKAGNYDFSPSTISDANYTIGTANGTFTINAKPFARGTGAGQVTITVSNNEKTYNGAAQNATIVVHDNDLDQDLAADDYTISYAGDDNTTWTAGRVISVTGKRNYAATKIDLDGVTDKQLIINKKALTIFVDDQTKIYNGTTAIPAVTFSYSGLVGADIANAAPFGDNFEAAYVTPTSNEYKVGSYAVKAKVKDGANFTGTTWANYDVTYPNIGLLTVVKRTVKITVVDKSKSFGDANPAFTYTVAGVEGDTGATTTTMFGGSTDKALLEGIYNVVREGTNEAVGVYSNELKLSEKTDLNNNQKNVLKQYTIQEVKGKFTINAATLTVTPKKVTITYGEDYDLSTFEVIATNTSGTRVNLTTSPTVKFAVADYNTNNPKAAGIYTLVLDGEIAADGYDGASAVRNDGQLVINQKALTIVLGKQTLMVGDKADALRPSKVQFNDGAGDPGLVGDDVIGFKLAFNNGGGAGQIADTKFTGSDPTKELLPAAVGDYATGVKIAEDLSVEGNANANYTFNWDATGALKVVAADGLALLSDNDDITNITKLNGANIGGNITLDLNPRNAQALPAGTAREWGAKQWNTLVLPFDITIEDLSKAFGYAIVNVVDPSKTTVNNVRFKLEMDMVPANTPFTIKTSKKLIGANATEGITVEGDPNEGIITFVAPVGGRDIVAPTAAQKAGVEAGMGYKFVPCYELLTVDNTMSALRFLLGNNANWAKIGSSSSNKWNIIPLAAYVDLSASSAPEQVTFTFEEIDGSTTTIKAIESGLIDGSVKGYTMEGWYNLNGVKLEGVPTQKGIYINNGKKVVIK